ncbi:DUF1045 domain-containing protein [Pseudorhodoplanes sinuspersici]|uniref:Uncharacterized protein n=1 Tax=Pseudorhodoplanes sinuspersici TaxID=1235591 RepID=A0A1W6ZYV6_9HYPH|nr:DUF1045 domain-containing protein [Pseudorhodoplanes sinuspersici]ARQ02500.1 hypothetical protein CAK95_27845 [Pseudorhodoplanes sinuspersici]RKE74340.1 putative phosphonate metabolism protein [Pseudorhodoplanes sinuspersici]
MQDSSPRYAIYFTPQPSTSLAQFGASVLGYDSFAGESVTRLALDGIAAAALEAATAAPRKYGFHATLVAPFYLHDNRTEGNLLEALDTFCDRANPVLLGSLRVNALGDFIALTPDGGSLVDELARQCVTFFDTFRTPLGPGDIARRSNGRLTPRQQAHLTRWGYPYVFGDFRFHMTLTGSLAADEKSRFLTALADAFAPLAGQTYDVDAVSLLRQADSHSCFEVMARKDLQGKR